MRGSPLKKNYSTLEQFDEALKRGDLQAAVELAANSEEEVVKDSLDMHNRYDLQAES